MSIQPRKQRKALYNAPHHVRRKQMASHLSEELLLKYNRRRVTVVRGDEVRIMRGGSKGHTGRVVGVDTSARKVTVDGVNHKKADGTEVPMPVDPSNLLILRLNLEDKRRRARLGDTEEPVKAAKPKASKSAVAAAPSSPATPAAAATTTATATSATGKGADATAKAGAPAPPAPADGDGSASSAEDDDTATPSTKEEEE